MSITSTSYVNEDGNAVIVLFNDIEFNNANWTATAYFNVIYTSIDLYPTQLSGVGILSNSNKTLTIVIPSPPKVILLQADGFGKLYQLGSGELNTGAELVYASNITLIDRRTRGRYDGPAFILFNGSDNPIKVKSSDVVAKIVQNNKVLGYMLGVPFSDNYGLTPARYYGFGGVIFTKTMIPENININDDLFFVFESINDTFQTEIFWNGSTFIGPTSEKFNVGDGYVFTQKTSGQSSILI